MTAAIFITGDCIYHSDDGDPFGARGRGQRSTRAGWLPMRVPDVISRTTLVEALHSSDSAVVSIGGDTSPELIDLLPEDGLLATAVPVTEATKVVADGIIVRSVDRGSLVQVGVPMLIHRSTLLAVLKEQSGEAVDLALAVARRGGRVVAMPDPSPA